MGAQIFKSITYGGPFENATEESPRYVELTDDHAYGGSFESAAESLCYMLLANGHDVNYLGYVRPCLGETERLAVLLSWEEWYAVETELVGNVKSSAPTDVQNRVFEAFLITNVMESMPTDALPPTLRKFDFDGQKWIDAPGEPGILVEGCSNPT